MLHCRLCGELLLETLEELVDGQALYCPACDAEHLFYWINETQGFFQLEGPPLRTDS